MNTSGLALNPADILTPAELAQRLRVSKAWVYEATRSRSRNGAKPLPHLRLGKYLRFDWNAVSVWLRESGKEV